MNYEEILANTTAANARNDSGIVVVLVRIAEHIGYLVAHIAARSSPDVAHDLQELGDIMVHANTLVTTRDTVSSAANGNLLRLRLLLSALPDGWETLDEETRKERLSDVSNRLAHVAAVFDTEMAGLPAAAAANV
jgi:hypothetical protein